jgi:hypothetical protein
MVFSMRHMEKNQTIHAEAKFLSETKSGAIAPDQILANQEAMSHSASTNSYIYDGPALKAGEAYTYVWSRKNEAKPSGKLSTTPSLMSDIAFKDTPLSHNSATTLTWKGQSLQDNDVLVLLWQDASTQATFTTQVTGAAIASQLGIPAFELKKIPKGNYKLTLIRKRLEQNESPEYKAKIQVEIYHKPIDVTIS